MVKAPVFQGAGWMLRYPSWSATETLDLKFMHLPPIVEGKSNLGVKTCFTIVSSCHLFVSGKVSSTYILNGICSSGVHIQTFEHGQWIPKPPNTLSWRLFFVETNTDKRCIEITLPETNSSHLKGDGWKMIPFLLGPGPFSERLLFQVHTPTTTIIMALVKPQESGQMIFQAWLFYTFLAAGV